MLDDILIPHAIPAKKVAGCQMPEDAANLLSWDFVSAHMRASQHYWLTTIAADGQPHAVPVWGIWYRNRLHFEGGMKTALVYRAEEDVGLGWRRITNDDPMAVSKPIAPPNTHCI